MDHSFVAQLVLFDLNHDLTLDDSITAKHKVEHLHKYQKAGVDYRGMKLILQPLARMEGNLLFELSLIFVCLQ